MRKLLNYIYDKSVVDISETASGRDVEFRIRAIGEAALEERLRLVQQQFERNKTMTDVLFYAFVNRTYKFIVREDYYIDFILALMKHRVVEKVEWKQGMD